MVKADPQLAKAELTGGDGDEFSAVDAFLSFCELQSGKIPSLGQIWNHTIFQNLR